MQSGRESDPLLLDQLYTYFVLKNHIINIHYKPIKKLKQISWVKSIVCAICYIN